MPRKTFKCVCKDETHYLVLHLDSNHLSIEAREENDWVDIVLTHYQAKTLKDWIEENLDQE